MITRSPSRRYRVAVVRGSLDARPVVVSSAAGSHSSFAPILPSVRWYTQIWARAKYLSSSATGRELRIHRRLDMPPRTGRLRVADDDRDGPVGPRLVIVVGRVHVHQLGPV